MKDSVGDIADSVYSDSFRLSKAAHEPFNGLMTIGEKIKLFHWTHLKVFGNTNKKDVLKTVALISGCIYTLP